MDQLTPKWSKAGNRDWQDTMAMRKHLLGEDIDLGQSLRDRGIGGWSTDPVTGERVEMGEDAFGSITLGNTGAGAANKFQQSFEGLLQNAADYGIDPSEYMKEFQALGQAGKRKDLYGWSGHQSNKVGDIMSYDVDQFKDITGRLFGDISDAKQNALARMVENKYGDQGISGEDFLSGQFLDKQGLATQGQADKMLALQNLMGKQTNTLGLTPESQVGQDTAFLEQLRQDLAGSQPEVKTGGTGSGGGKYS
jgi:hypothetical protein